MVKFGKDFNGNNVTPEEYIDGLSVICENDKFGIVDTTAKHVLPTIFSKIGKVSEKIVPVSQGHLWGCINIDFPKNKDGKPQYIIPEMFREMHPMSCGAMVVQRATSPKYSFITLKQSSSSFFLYVKQKADRHSSLAMIMPGLRREVYHSRHGQIFQETRPVAVLSIFRVCRYLKNKNLACFPMRRLQRLRRFGDNRLRKWRSPVMFLAV